MRSIAVGLLPNLWREYNYSFGQITESCDSVKVKSPATKKTSSYFRYSEGIFSSYFRNPEYYCVRATLSKRHIVYFAEK